VRARLAPSKFTIVMNQTLKFCFSGLYNEDDTRGDFNEVKTYLATMENPLSRGFHELLPRRHRVSFRLGGVEVWNDTVPVPDTVFRTIAGCSMHPVFFTWPN
jgi:hypothetical protein